MTLFVSTFILAMGIVLPCLVLADTSEKTPSTSSADLDASAKAALAWLSVVDKGEYPLSWDRASMLMQATIHKDEWVKLMNSTRKPLGSVASRKVQDQRVARDPHGLPQGEYMVIYYSTAFSTKSHAKELITLRLEDGQWHVLTYQIDSGK